MADPQCSAVGVEAGRILEDLMLTECGGHGVVEIMMDDVLVFLVLGGGRFAKKGHAEIQAGMMIQLSGVE